MRVVLATKLFPNAVQPWGSLYNRYQYSALGHRCTVEVLGLIPWFPGIDLLGRWSAAATLSAVPRFERIAGLPVYHPRVPYIPKVPTLTPPLFAAGLIHHLLRRRKHVDVLVGSGAYPDGVACVWLGRLLNIPTVLQVVGTDLNVIPTLVGPRQILKWTLARADRIITVSAPLRDRAIELGADPARTVTIPNGVDTTIFHPRDKMACRTKLGLPADEKLIVFVGSLTEAKGVNDLLLAFESMARSLADVRLVLVGAGPARDACQAVACRMNGRVTLAGVQAPEEVAVFLGAADVFVLPSWREGTPNVILEALASGRRVVATAVGGIPDLVTTRTWGEVVRPRDPQALADALRRALDENSVLQGKSHELPTWHDSAGLLHDVLADLVEEKHGRHRVTAA
jgi:glycosyltransferase involved in cell wall biosynthesis